jgi:hypothetical protein
MYTLSIAMAARLFVVCFDLGAQANRVKDWGWGEAISPDLAPSAINDLLIALARSLAACPDPPLAPETAHYPDLLRSFYGFAADERERILGRASAHGHPHRASPHFIRERRHAHFH